MVKIIFFHAAFWPQTSMAAGRNLPSDKLSWNDKAADGFRPLGCAVVPASIMPRGFFATFADHPERGKTDATSLIRREGR
ncbi:hypothetical protein RFM68_09455 [Mesorhizobium sp. MSK_1335]|uniref:Uncharacterized protein n=1 Tax=Mesorhizobium montanum TaxID=3072323 RepID=A0ABU4ZH84_9HYPH|nr:hypothetical protein [Mesorhizobium sp. MSK_1335]MDX8524734.1 hypothetical protein [Mesorhizobium sp. MSK_1335]